MDKDIHALAELFRTLPGVGARQARRFVYALLSRDQGFRSDIAERIETLGERIAQCPLCFRFFGGKGTCDLCNDPHAEKTTLLVIEKDVDLDNIRRMGVYNGLYFVLGGLLPLMAEHTQDIRAQALVDRIAQGKFKEVILALSANAEGDNTTQYIKKILEPLTKKGLVLTVLGRGLSTGTELEYSDEFTFGEAFKSRRS